MLFVCGPARRGVALAFVYAVLDRPAQQQQQHSIRIGVGTQLYRLTKMRQQITADWLTATNIVATECTGSVRQLKQSPGNKTSVYQQRQNKIEPNFRILYVSVCVTRSAKFIKTADTVPQI